MVKIILKDLNVEQMSNSSGIFSGDNIQVNWKAFRIDNIGHGNVTGSSNKISDTTSIVKKAKPDKTDT